MHRKFSRSGPSPLELAKEALSIPDLAAKRGWEWTPGRSCKVPYRADRSESGSVMNEGKLFHDFASGETMDGPGLLAKVENLDARTACKLFIELAGIRSGEWSSSNPRPAYVPPAKVEAPHEKPILPPLAPLSEKERRALAALRGLSVDAVEMAHKQGLLWGLWWRNQRAWAMTDRERWNCQWRRLDGGKWEREDNESKFKSWGVKQKGNNRPRPGWPVGILEAAGVPNLALVEGGPDMLAAFHFIHAAGMVGRVAPVLMFGVSRIDEIALPFFAGRRVRLFCHADKPSLDHGTKRPGLEAAARWQPQLLSVRCVVDSYDFTELTRADGEPVTDLCDLANLCDSDREAERENLDSLMIFE